jgi:hypothetical protein
MRSRIRLVHWKAESAAAAAGRLRGFDVDASPVTPQALRALGRNPPDAIVIDLDRLPSQGRDVAIVLRRQKGTRPVPLVFAGGAADKVAPIRGLLPDAVYAPWSRAAAAARRAIAARPHAAQPVAPAAMAGYSGTPLPRKLGIKPGSQVRLVAAPTGFEQTVGELPDGARLLRRGGAAADLTLLFVRSARELAARLPGALPPRGLGLWILWPKRGSALAADVSERAVRAAGMAAGMVDFKVCAVDETWSGLRFAWPRKPGVGGKR